MQEGEIKDTDNMFLKDTTDKQSEKRKLLEEIGHLENKILEVNQLLYRHILSPSMRLQLKDDLDYHQQQIELKRQLLQEIYGEKK